MCVKGGLDDAHKYRSSTRHEEEATWCDRVDHMIISGKT